MGHKAGDGGSETQAGAGEPAGCRGGRREEGPRRKLPGRVGCGGRPELGCLGPHPRRFPPHVLFGFYKLPSDLWKSWDPESCVSTSLRCGQRPATSGQVSPVCQAGVCALPASPGPQPPHGPPLLPRPLSTCVLPSSLTRACPPGQALTPAVRPSPLALVPPPKSSSLPHPLPPTEHGFP